MSKKKTIAPLDPEHRPEDAVIEQQLKVAENALPELTKLSVGLDKAGFPTEARLVGRVHDRLDAVIRGVSYLDEKRAKLRERRKQ